jgi:hypothetical protein
VLEGRVALTAFTLTSPTSQGALPAGVTPVGGIVLDLVGVNGRRVVSQLPASSLFRGFFSQGVPVEFLGNPGTIGVQSGITPAILQSLGGGLSEVAVRLTLFDGDTGEGDFDFGQNVLLLNGLPLGDFSGVLTQETTHDGQTALTPEPVLGFRNNQLHTGFFYTAEATFLTALYDTLTQTGTIRFQLKDADPYDNLFDFTLGVEGGLIDVGQPPTLSNEPPVITSITSDAPVPQGSPVRVTVIATDPDSGGRPLTYEFDFDNDGIYETATLTGMALHTYADAGDFVVRVRVVDGDGGEATSSVTVTVREVLLPPVEVPPVEPLPPVEVPPVEPLPPVVEVPPVEPPLPVEVSPVQVSPIQAPPVESPPAASVPTAPPQQPAPPPVQPEAALSIALQVSPQPVFVTAVSNPVAGAVAVVTTSSPLPQPPESRSAQYLVGGGAAPEQPAEEPERSPGAADLVVAITQIATPVVGGAVSRSVQAGSQVANVLDVLVAQALNRFQTQAARIASASVEPGSASLPLVADPPAPLSPANTTSPPVPVRPATAVRATGPAVRTGMLVMTALLLQRSWSNSRVSAANLHRRRHHR